MQGHIHCLILLFNMQTVLFLQYHALHARATPLTCYWLRHYPAERDECGMTRQNRQESQNRQNRQNLQFRSALCLAEPRSPATPPAPPAPVPGLPRQPSAAARTPASAAAPGVPFRPAGGPPPDRVIPPASCPPTSSATSGIRIPFPFPSWQQAAPGLPAGGQASPGTARRPSA